MPLNIFLKIFLVIHGLIFRFALKRVMHNISTTIKATAKLCIFEEKWKMLVAPWRLLIYASLLGNLSTKLPRSLTGLELIDHAFTKAV